MRLFSLNLAHYSLEYTDHRGNNEQCAVLHQPASKSRLIMCPLLHFRLCCCGLMISHSFSQRGISHSLSLSDIVCIFSVCLWRSRLGASLSSHNPNTYRPSQVKARKFPTGVSTQGISLPVTQCMLGRAPWNQIPVYWAQEWLTLERGNDFVEIQTVQKY